MLGSIFEDRVFKDRAVSPDVAAERGYRRFAVGEVEAVLGADERLSGTYVEDG